MSLSHAGKKLGIMISAKPDSRNFRHGIELAKVALEERVEVFLYCIDEAVRGLESKEVQGVKAKGAKLFGCAYSLQKRDLPLTEGATMAGLTILNDVVSATDRFISFN